MLKSTIRQWGKTKLPQLNGRLYLPGLHHPVTIRRDGWGIPHIHAHNRHDLFFAQGVVHAQDRLWQMELNRRAAHGTLSAVFGRITLDTDRFTRTLGFARLARQSWPNLDEKGRADVTAYTAGVNAYLGSRPPLPIEFALLRHQPEPWQPLDTLAYGRLQMWALTAGASGELLHAELLQRLGPEKTAELLPHYPSHNPTTLPFPPNPFTRSPVHPFSPFLGKLTHDGASRGSNGWVIAPWRSTTGHALLCNDMHLPIGTPSIWYFIHLHSDDGLHVAGFSQPGLPYVLVGQNDFIAWGATLAYTDCEDYFLEQFHPMDATRYRFAGEWRKAEIYAEHIPIRGQGEHVEQVVVTHHGPVIRDWGLEISTISNLQSPISALALSSTALQAQASFDGFARLNEAKNWEEFVTAVSPIEAPPLNLLYADRQGNIGYYVSGRVPVRAKGDGLLPVPGWTAEYEWIGHIPFHQMPHAFNPPQGYIISANHRIAGETYPHYLGQAWRNGNRAHRLEQLITAQTKVSPADCQRFQNDFGCLPGLELIKQLAHLQPTHPDAILSLELLRGWDGWLGPDSVAGAVYEVLLARLARAILGPHLGQSLTQQYLGLGTHPNLAPVNEFQGYWSVTLLRLLDNPQSMLLPLEKRDELLERCLAETTAELRQYDERRRAKSDRRWAKSAFRSSPLAPHSSPLAPHSSPLTSHSSPLTPHSSPLAPHSSFPSWGQLHRITFAHALEAQAPFDRIFNQGPFPIGGDGDTPAQTSIRPDAPYDNNAISISSRLVVDMGDLSHTQAMLAPGQSGHLASPHYGDLITPWLNGGYFQVAWGENEVTAVCQHTLVLKPQE